MRRKSCEADIEVMRSKPNRHAVSVVDMPIEMIFEYEVLRAGWPQLVSWKWAQNLTARLLARRTRKIAKIFAQTKAVRSFVRTHRRNDQDQARGGPKTS